MNKSSFIFKGADGKDVFTWCWCPPDSIRGVLQIFHGMAEHAERYEDLALYLNNRGFAVYACDQRGHGRTGEMNGSLNHFEGDGFNGIVEDQKLLAGIIRQKYHDVPLFVLGHSFGSFVAQEYIKHHGAGLSGVILSGSCFMKGPDIKAGYIVAVLSLAAGRKKPNKFLNSLSFGSYNKTIDKPASKFSWLSCDENQVARYEADKFCGNVMSTNFYYYFFKGLNRLYNADSARIPKNLPIYILSGDADPVGKYGKGTEKLYDWYNELGISDLQMKLYEGARHEIINEINRDEVFDDIAEWLIDHLQVCR